MNYNMPRTEIIICLIQTNINMNMSHIQIDMVFLSPPLVPVGNTNRD